MFFLSLPAAYLLAIRLGYGLKGIWLGLIVGSLAQSGIYLYVLAFRVHWKKMALKIASAM